MENLGVFPLCSVNRRRSVSLITADAAWSACDSLTGWLRLT